jgi:hypothetical protein
MPSLLFMLFLYFEYGTITAIFSFFLPKEIVISSPFLTSSSISEKLAFKSATYNVFITVK